MALIDDIVSYWKYDVNSSTQADSAGGKDATVTNAVYNASGKINGAYDFNGSDTVISASSIVGFGTSDFSISFWFKTSGNLVQGCMGYGDRYDSTGWAAIIYNGYARFIIDDGTTQVICDSDTNGWNDGDWHFYVATADKSGDLTIYIDGSDVGSCSISTIGNMTTASHNVIDMGAYWYQGAIYSTSYLDGILDEPATWDVALSQSQVTSLYNSGDGFQYPFSDTSGTIIPNLMNLYRQRRVA